MGEVPGRRQTLAVAFVESEEFSEHEIIYKCLA